MPRIEGKQFYLHFDVYCKLLLQIQFLLQVKKFGQSVILMKLSHFDLAVTLTLTFCEKNVLIFCKTDTIQIIVDSLIFNKYVKENLADVFID